MKVINIYAGPGAGKTTQGHDLTAYLKKKGYDVEMIPEVAKHLVHQERQELKTNQIYVFSEQFRPYRYLDGNVDIVIAECPLLLSIVYNRHYKIEDNPHFDDLVLFEHNRFDNFDIYLSRETEYKKRGRYQDEDGAIEVDRKTKETLKEYGMEYITLGLDNFLDNTYNAMIDGGFLDKV